jgi:hypothetical protein
MPNGHEPKDPKYFGEGGKFYRTIIYEEVNKVQLQQEQTVLEQQIASMPAKKTAPDQETLAHWLETSQVERRRAAMERKLANLKEKLLKLG